LPGVEQLHADEACPVSRPPARELAQAIDDALRRLPAAVEAGLAARGWRWLDVGFRPLPLAFTCDVGGGFWATAALIRRDTQIWPPEWPVSLELIFGVGYEPATALMPLVTLFPRVTLLPEPDTARAFSLSGPDALDDLARQVIDAVVSHGTAFAEQHSSIEELSAALVAQGDVGMPYRAVLLAAGGDLAEARRVLDELPVQQDEGSEDWRAKRVVRQLTRWLDAGGGDIPPLQESLSWLVPRVSMPRPSRSFADHRAEARNAREAVTAVKAAAHGRSVDEITAMLIAEHERRGVDLPPHSAPILAEQIAEAQGPIGRARHVASSLRVLRDFVGLGVDIAKHRVPSNPDWMRPPDRASYPVRPGTEHGEVTLDDDAKPWLDRVARAAARRIGPMVTVQLWLTSSPEGDGTLVVHLGEKAVGRLAAPVAARFAADMRAAHFFDEDPRTFGQLFVSPSHARIFLQISLPRPVADE
jgi:hypothetical protein